MRRRAGPGERLRRVADVVVAGVLLVVALPLLLTAGLAVLLLSGRPVFYGHVRVGRDGRPFRCWKLRTMRNGADAALERDDGLRDRWQTNGYKVPGDPRVTVPGRWLRRTYLDELPQLFNVLNGTMSLVGPRPVVREELDEFAPHQDELFSVRPGIFGRWNSRGRARPDYPERARLELEYVRNRSLRVDLAILARSVPAVLQGQDEEL